MNAGSVVNAEEPRFIQSVYDASHLVNWAADTTLSLIENMRINHRGLDIFVAEEFLNCANIIASFEQVCGEGVPESVWCNSFV